MVSKSANATKPEQPGPAALFDVGREQTEAMLGIQKELLQAYEQASRAWLARVRSEVDLWSQLATRLSATRSMPEAIQAYQECMAQRVQMAVDDGKQLADDCQTMMEKISRSASNERTVGRT